MARFRWNAWSIGPIAEHDVDPVEAELVVRNGERRKIGDKRYKAIGRGIGGRWIQAIYIFDPPGVVYVIHARPLTESEKHRARRRFQ